MADELKVFTGNTHPALARSICDYLGAPLGQMDVFEFSNENIFVRILENVRGRDVFMVQPISSPVNKSLMELLIMIDAAKRASADRVTAVIPYYGYARTDKKDQPRVPITARLVADLITVAGASRVLTIDLHAGQIQGFFNIPVDELTALYILSRHFEEKQLDDLVVVATDIGISKRARDMAARLNTPLAIIEKRRLGNTDEAEMLTVIGDVEGRHALLVDDEIDTGSSITSAALTLSKHGAKEIYACCTHAILSGPAVERIANSPLKEMVVTDSIPVPESKQIDRITVLSLAALIGEAIHRIHADLSIGAMFQ
ncbi:ribose-phosphate pyrophosphokinase [Dehalococcoidia bacterium]|nr:ribose-phosphate pyrophosphokinase [Dehalococcoidia bacterium]MCL0078456.1 ribose-phosphate pyrophosphokinase [Dehalococcoidia bacterium]MCL0089792.1 ribose-phosphate pyrophosphokinase [Dehalococcoidia bacterium]MCL0097697.1 ribose-phosphate pyrophosphokinase [Dehalococcoidia bacterium]